jgi:phenylacetate-CoA ligase
LSTQTKIDKEQIYLKLPTALQNLAVSIEGYRLKQQRYDSLYQEIFEQVKQRQSLDHQALKSYQERRLRQFLHIAKNSPFWEQRFSEFRLDLDASDIIAEFKKLPILSKAEVKASVDQIANPHIPQEDLLSCHTSGTTGSGLIFPETKSAEKERWATWWRYRGWHNIDFNAWCGYFGGRSIVPMERDKSPFWRVNTPGKQLMFSAYHLKPETARDYLTALKQYGISWLHGYPSVLALFASYILEQKLDPGNTVKIITIGAESLLPQQKQIIELAFKAPVRQHYGQAESVANISECPDGNLHVDEDFSFVEFLPIEGQENSCKIIGTNWTNPAFPLLRYDCGDLATLSSNSCPCGHHGRVVVDIDGRKEDYVLLPNGVRVGRLDHIFKDLTHIREAQIHQREKGSVTLLIVKGDGYDLHDEESYLLAEARKRLGADLNISLEYVDQIKRSRTGKLRFVISDSEEMLDSGSKSNLVRH